MNLKNYLTLALVCAVFALNGQIIFSEDFSGGSIPAGWTNVDLTSAAGEEVLFVHTTDPDAVAPAALGNGPTSFFGAPGASDGYLWANSDRGLASAPATLHTTELTTTAIDCSAAADVFFSMEALIGVFQLDASDNAILRVSTNGGTDWTAFTLFPNLTTAERWSENSFLSSVDISSVAAGEAAVLLQIQWTGGWEYFMAIDDIVLTSEDPRPANSMRVNQFAAVAPNVRTPFSQVEPIGFIADIENIGSGDQTNVTLTISVTDDATGTEVFSDMLDYGDVASDELAENVFFENEFTPAAMPANYTATYALNYDNLADDAEPANTTRSFPIIITDSVFSKSIDATRSVAPAADNSFSYGNTYYVNNATDPVSGEPLLGKSITFGMSNPDDIAGQSLTAFLYEWDGDTNDDFLANQDEYQPVGFASYMVEGGEGNALITVPLESLTGDVIMLQEDKHYIAAVQYADETNTTFFLLASEEFDYAAMNFYTDSLMRQRFAGALDVSNEGEFSMIGFGLDIVPVVRLNIGIETIIDATEPQLPKGAVQAFPNPADKFVNVDFDLQEPTSGTMTLISAKGQILQTQELENVMSDRIRVDTAELPSGMYIIRIDTEQGVSNRPISVQH